MTWATASYVGPSGILAAVSRGAVAAKAGLDTNSSLGGSNLQMARWPWTHLRDRTPAPGAGSAGRARKTPDGSIAQP